MRGARRPIVGELLHDGQLYEVLICGHARRGIYGRDGMSTCSGRLCPICGGEPDWRRRLAGFLPGKHPITGVTWTWTRENAFDYEARR